MKERYSVVWNFNKTARVVRDNLDGRILGPWHGSVPGEERLSAQSHTGHEGACFVCGGRFQGLSMIESGGLRRPVCTRCEGTLVSPEEMERLGTAGVRHGRSSDHAAKMCEWFTLCSYTELSNRPPSRRSRGRHRN